MPFEMLTASVAALRRNHSNDGNRAPTTAPVKPATVVAELAPENHDVMPEKNVIHYFSSFIAVSICRVLRRLLQMFQQCVLHYQDW